MHPVLKVARKDIRTFLSHFSDERLAALLAHAQDAKLAFYSCCCLVGSATADHALQPRRKYWGEREQREPHYVRALELPGSDEAEWAFGHGLLAGARVWNEAARDALRRRRIIPILKAELRRRQHIRGLAPWRLEAGS
jgi:hypothetical protein